MTYTADSSLETHSLVLDPTSARNLDVRFVLIGLNLIISLSSEHMDGFLAGPSVGQY